MRVKTNSTMRLFSPAKVNLLLAVTGKRDDGFHDLVSLVTPLEFGDFIEVAVSGDAGSIQFTCSESSVPLGADNLVVQAVEAFRRGTGWDLGLNIHLEKHIPMEAGLGGGSSNAATTLLALNELAEKPLEMEALSELAATLGSDCPLFLHRAPLIMRGRGEQIEHLPAEVSGSLEGQAIAVFKPSIGISTPWAYGVLAGHPSYYADSVAVENRLESWRKGELSLKDLLHNSFERPVFEKFVAFPTLFDRIRSELGLHLLMSGSGASCFCLLPDMAMQEPLEVIVKDAFSDSVFFKVCRLGANV